MDAAMPPNPRPKLLSTKALAAAAAVVVAAGACSVGDQLCPQGTDYNEDGDACPYGPPAGPKGLLGECPAPAIDCNTAGQYTWRDHVFPLFDNGDLAIAGCTAGTACHAPGGSAPTMTPGNESETYANLTAYLGSAGIKYVNPQDPSRSWIMCNLRNQLGKGMPKNANNRMPESEVLKVEAWVVCGGAQQDGMGATTSTTGTGGAGGEGGAVGGGGAGGIGGI
jgi:hypothetical protein